MVNSAAAQQVTRSYGPIAFVAALGNILVVEVAVWVFLPWFVLAVFVLPLLLVDLAIAALLRARPGNAGQIGRGMLIGLISAPMTLAVFLPGFLLVQAMGFV
ncbi:hypothetical protein [Mycolicibacterium litorale]|uniref:Uncharacterized protein n=1 Tax=Mycolicibacterium litorale TaxID=758802 RepID=A0AAD1ILL4_9MYCO|nr:hypothetical protein [Mycolicibacterium litorale]MCV7416524.1 hypothetical protein [Mycolicibacterium litorale]TDY09777.1 hypothetical protein BCL50_1874 [Mycolicibacterium litorale]BBY17724.1 hypothetical protein MLIT_33160 [Mycolicibacterium litorale]